MEMSYVDGCRHRSIEIEHGLPSSFFTEAY